MTMIAKTEIVDGKLIEIHEGRHGACRYWAKVDGTALFQRGRIRLRMFTTVDAAWQAALKTLRRTT